MSFSLGYHMSTCVFRTVRLQRDNLPSCSLPLPRSNRREGTRLPRGVAAGQSRQSKSRVACTPRAGERRAHRAGGGLWANRPLQQKHLQSLLHSHPQETAVPPRERPKPGGLTPDWGRPRPPPLVNLSMRCCLNVLLPSVNTVNKCSKQRHIQSAAEKQNIYYYISQKKV